MKIGQIVGIAVGVWLMAAPAVLGYTGTGIDDAHRVAGPLAASFAVIACWPATAAVRWANLAVAVGLVAALPLGPFHAEPVANALACAAALVLATPFGGASTARFAGGWSALVTRRSDAGT